jgi:tetratricopeptide (TPR) repeat protein
MTGSSDLLAEAVAELRQALALDPRYVPARLYLAHLYLDLGRPARARAELEAALAVTPRSPQLLAVLAETERRDHQRERALDVARQALALDESFAQARYTLGLVLLDLGRQADAIVELERVVSSGVNRPEVWLGLGAAYLDAGRVDQGLATLKRGVALDQSNPDLRVQLARAYRLKGLLAEAERELGRARPSSVTNAPFFQYQQAETERLAEEGLIAVQRGRLTAAEDAFTRVLGIDARHPAAHRHLAEVYLAQRRFAEAATHAARADELGAPLAADKRRQIAEGLRATPSGPRR